MQKRKAFTMVELIFVIVIIGILSAVAIPKLAATRDDAEISKARVTVAALRNAIATERQKRILSGNFNDINKSTIPQLLEYGLPADWNVTSTNQITYTADNGQTCVFNFSGNKLVKTDTCTAAGFSDL